MGSPLEGKYTNQLGYGKIHEQDSKIIPQLTNKLIYVHNPNDMVIMPFTGSAGPLDYATVNISVDISHGKMWESDYIRDKIWEEINR